MKKKFRKIIVDDREYAYSVVSNFDDGGNIIKIWKDKKLIYDSWDSETEQVTPRYIAELIGNELDYE